jgi:hypothetical protein
MSVNNIHPWEDLSHVIELAQGEDLGHLYPLGEGLKL